MEADRLPGRPFGNLLKTACQNFWQFIPANFALMDEC
jgi:hypothetical protein